MYEHTDRRLWWAAVDARPEEVRDGRGCEFLLLYRPLKIMTSVSMQIRHKVLCVCLSKAHRRTGSLVDNIAFVIMAEMRAT